MSKHKTVMYDKYVLAEEQQGTGYNSLTEVANSFLHKYRYPKKNIIKAKGVVIILRYDMVNEPESILIYTESKA